MVKNLRLKIYELIKHNWILIIILVAGAFLRLYKIDQYMTFLGDEGRDVIIVRNLLVHKDLFLIGPGTSVGNMYLGPLYYYLIAIPLLVANFSPIGPAVFVALLGVFTIWFVYFVGCEWFSKRAAIIASLFYAVSPTVVIFSHSSWNPNIMPFFALLTVYSIWRVWKKSHYYFLLILGVSMAFVLQSHYLGLLLVPVVFVFWVLELFKFRFNNKWAKEVDGFMGNSIIGVTIFLVLMSPLLIFDIRHNWLNTNALVELIQNRQETVSASPWEGISQIPKVAKTIVTSLLAAKIENLGSWILAILSIPSIVLVLSRRKLHKNEASGFSFLFVWLFFGLVGFGFYRQEVYDHYFGVLFPAVFLFFAGFIDGVLENLSNFGKFLVFSLLVVLLVVNIYKTPISKEPNRQMARAQDVANKVLEIVEGKPFNLAVLAERNYEDGYKYFMDLANAEVLHADRWDEKTISDTLIVICEMSKEKCDPTHSPKAEVANFGWSKIDSDFEVDGVIIYKLIHSK